MSCFKNVACRLQHQRRALSRLVVLIVIFGSAASSVATAETGAAAWLRYQPLEGAALAEMRASLPVAVVVESDSLVTRTASAEIVRGLQSMAGRILRVETAISDESAIVLAAAADCRKADWAQGLAQDAAELGPEGFLIAPVTRGDRRLLAIVGGSERGVLYGAFAFLRQLAIGQSLWQVQLQEQPCAPLRVVNQWDNLDGSIERGYAGRSIFWDGGRARQDLRRVAEYGRLLASVGVNGCSINNVNADARVVSPELLPDVERIAAALRPWGVKVYISLNFAAPREVGGVDTFDPLDPRAAAFWKHAVDAAYTAVPDLGGFVLKADSEGRLGPSQYGRTHADAANVIARAAKPHGGILFYRGFVYDHKMDWRDRKNDRATAAYYNFHPLDGKFDDNVVVQIKHGPIDFQVREPASPLFGALEATNQAIELQISQEYLGQQEHLVYIAPMWKEALDFDMHAAPTTVTGATSSASTPVKRIVAGSTFHRPLGGFAGVANVGRDVNWLGHHFAMANLYAFGRLAWNADLPSEVIAEEWTRQTFGSDQTVVATIVDMLMQSWPIYESYTGNLGIGTLTDIIHIHFGPAPESSEYNGWGQWHRADEHGVGMDRTVATGTGFIGQYRPEAAAKFESLATCPEELLLFMHHVPYVHRLHDSRTVIQRIYDDHYRGAAKAQGFVATWRSLQKQVDEQRYQEVLERLEFQAAHAIVWRDSVCRWFARRSGIADEKGRVGRYPNRLEAEDQRLEGYQPSDAVPWESASNDKLIQLPEAVPTGTATFAYVGPPQWCDIAVRYYDEEDGESTFRLRIGNREADRWVADQHVPTPTTAPDAHSSRLRIVSGEWLRPGDSIYIEGQAADGERAALDYIEIVPSSREQ